MWRLMASHGTQVCLCAANEADGPTKDKSLTCGGRSAMGSPLATCSRRHAERAVNATLDGFLAIPAFSQRRDAGSMVRGVSRQPQDDARL